MKKSLQNLIIVLAAFFIAFAAHVMEREVDGAKRNIHSSAKIGKGADIDPTAIIGPDCYIGKRVKIGPGVVIHSACHIGDDCIIKENCVLGKRVKLYAGVTLYPACQLGRDVTLYTGVALGGPRVLESAASDSSAARENNAQVKDKRKSDCIIF